MVSRLRDVKLIKASRLSYVVLATMLLTLSSACEPGSGELTIVARLYSISSPPACGILHMGAVAEYRDLEVIEGRYSARKVFVIHGCPEIPRTSYAQDAGDVEEFRIGDYHELTLVPASRWDGDDVLLLSDKQPPTQFLATRALIVADDYFED